MEKHQISITDAMTAMTDYDALRECFACVYNDARVLVEALYIAHRRDELSGAIIVVYEITDDDIMDYTAIESTSKRSLEAFRATNAKELREIKNHLDAKYFSDAIMDFDI